jgi:radical SAM protein
MSALLTIPERRKLKRDFAVSPWLVFCELTRACDLVCLHCRACAQRAPAPDELSTTQSHALLQQIAEFPTPPLLVFTGGDPFKRRDLIELTGHATSLGLEVAITPSATPLVTHERLAALRDAGAHRIAVSLDGPEHESHDRFRGVAGSFQRTLEIIRDAQSVGFPVQVNTTVTPGNWQRIEEFAALLGDLNIVLWSVFFLVPVGRAEVQPRLSAEQVEIVFEQLWVESTRRGIPIKTTEAPHYRRFVAQQQKEMRAGGQSSPPRGQYTSLATNDGKGIMFVGHNGEIYPSGFMPIVCGVFPRDNVVEAYQHSPLFRNLRDPDLLQGKCGVCKFRTICGGSRARSYAVTGDPLAAEPDCAYVPEAWLEQATVPEDAHASAQSALNRAL